MKISIIHFPFQLFVITMLRVQPFIRRQKNFIRALFIYFCYFAQKNIFIIVHKRHRIFVDFHINICYNCKRKYTFRRQFGLRGNTPMQENVVTLPLGVNVNLDQLKREETVVCDMCGHVNPEGTAICEQCSNYLNRRLFSRR